MVFENDHFTLIDYFHLIEQGISKGEIIIAFWVVLFAFLGLFHVLFQSNNRICRNKRWNGNLFLSPTVMWLHTFSHHVTSCDMMWFGGSQHLTSCDMMWHDGTPCTCCYMMGHVVLQHHVHGATWCYMLCGRGATWCYMMSLTWCHMMSHDVTWCHLHDVTWYNKCW